MVIETQIMNNNNNEEHIVATYQEVKEWFEDEGFDNETSWNYILDCAEEWFGCQFLPGMDLETTNIHNWLSILYNN